ncbi:MAG TPA: glycosyltransferase family 39 protein [Thermoanaerobaculia bacterium]|nr:glycosyltransferase family 39 protein [Thermoanaerobaculia bacterium]
MSAGERRLTRSSWLLAAITLLAAFLRFYDLSILPPGLYPDEAMNGNNALQALARNDFDVFYPENHGREGLFINIQALFLAMLGNQPWVLRLPSAVLGTLTVPGLYILGRELFSRSTGLLASFFLAAGFWHINFSRTGFRAILAPFFLVWAVVFLVLALKETRPARRIILASLAGLLLGLGLHTYIAFRIMPLLLVVLVPLFMRDRKSAISMATCLAAASIAALPLAVHFFKHPDHFVARSSQVSVFQSESPAVRLARNALETTGMFHVAGDRNWRHNHAGKPQLFLPVGILFLVGIVTGLRDLRRVRPPATGGSGFHPALGIVLVFAWLVLAAVPVVLSDENLPHALRSILMIPPAFLLAGFGGVRLYRDSQRRIQGRWPAVVACIVLAAVAAHGYYGYFVSWGRSPRIADAFNADYVTLGRHLNRLPVEPPKYVVVRAEGEMVNGLPMPSQTTMFITDTFRPERQQQKRIFYLLPEAEPAIPEGALTFYID